MMKLPKTVSGWGFLFVRRDRVTGVFAVVLVLLACKSPTNGQGPIARPIPPAGPLASPKSIQQVGVPVQATREAIPANNPQTPEKIHDQ